MPTVSIILPTYNREKFLPDALAAIEAQAFVDWELIVVDDGSTDATRDLVPRLTSHFANPVRYVYQDNQGPYGARNSGLDHVTGTYVAFYDSDDLWLPHHLKDCVDALEANPNVDWVYGACRIVDYVTGKEISPSTFYVEGKPRPFMQIRTRSAGRLRIIDDSKVLQKVLAGSGLFSGLQNSVVRTTSFSHLRFDYTTRNEAEDQVFVMLLLGMGKTFAYIDNVHVIYCVHEANSSGAAIGLSPEKKRHLVRLTIDGFWKFPQRLRESAGRNLTLSETLALRRRISSQYFWLLGYSLYWRESDRSTALKHFALGLVAYPFCLAYWKTFVLSLLRCVLMPPPYVK